MASIPFEDILARIERKLATVREADPDLVIYGASQHRYQLNPCLSEAELTAFENHLGITLPLEYRAFLQRLGNGGAGPDNGLHPLNVHQPEEYTYLREPFPVSAELAREVVSRPQDERYLEGFEDVEFGGYLETTDSGCGTFSFLVVTGDQRGFMWGSGGGCELIPCVDKNGAQMGFLAWYEDWLDYCLRPEVIAYWSGLAKSR